MTGDFALLKQYLFMGKQLLAFMKSLGTKRPTIERSITIHTLTEVLLLEEISDILLDPVGSSDGRYVLYEHIVFLVDQAHHARRWTCVSRTDRRILDLFERLLKNSTPEEQGYIVFVERRVLAGDPPKPKIDLFTLIPPDIGFTSLITQARATCGR
jgi:hypothetical protein